MIHINTRWSTKLFGVIALSFSLIIIHRFKCCKQDSTAASAALAEPQEVLKAEGTEASIEEDAEAKAAEASYNCCGMW